MSQVVLAIPRSFVAHPDDPFKKDSAQLAEAPLKVAAREEFGQASFRGNSPGVLLAGSSAGIASPDDGEGVLSTGDNAEDLQSPLAGVGEGEEGILSESDSSLSPFRVDAPGKAIEEGEALAAGASDSNGEAG